MSNSSRNSTRSVTKDLTEEEKQKFFQRYSPEKRVRPVTIQTVENQENITVESVDPFRRSSLVNRSPERSVNRTLNFEEEENNLFPAEKEFEKDPSSIFDPINSSGNIKTIEKNKGPHSNKISQEQELIDFEKLNQPHSSTSTNKASFNIYPSELTQEEEEFKNSQTSPQHIETPQKAVKTSAVPELENFVRTHETIVLQDCVQLTVKPLPAPRMPTNGSLKAKDVVGMIPTFSGSKSDASFADFSEACLDAQKMLNPALEIDLTNMIRTRLKGSALRTARNGNPQNIKDLLKVLKGIFASRESSSTIHGELSNLIQKDNEDVATYFDRARNLGQHLIEAYKSENDDVISEENEKKFENLCCKFFVSGLKDEILNQLEEKKDLNKAGTEAINIEEQILHKETLKRNAIFKGNSNCLLCESINHRTTNCPKLEKNLTKCQLCKFEGHEADHCPNKRNSSSIKCHICKRFGHEARNCRDSFNRSREICQLCKKPGHILDECQQYSRMLIMQGTTQNRPSCSLCGMNNHNTQNCYSKLPCPKCGQTGHLARNCTNLFNTNNFNSNGYSGNNFRRNNNRGNFNNFNGNNRQPVPQSQQSRCEYCRKPGHSMNTCFLFKNDSTRQCEYCQQTGHNVDNCLSRKQALIQQHNQGNFTCLPVGEARDGINAWNKPSTSQMKPINQMTHSNPSNL